jgi:hypothetical protein
MLISSSHLVARAGSYGCGVGTGYADENATSQINNLTIWMSVIFAGGSDTGAWIGSGRAENDGCVFVGVVSISSCYVDAMSSDASDGVGIGAADARSGISRIDGLAIWNSIFNASRYGFISGIGCGFADSNGSTSIGTISISSCLAMIGSVWKGSGIGSGWSAFDGVTQIDSLAIHNSTIVVRAGFRGAGIGSGGAEGAEGPGASSRIMSLTIWCSSVMASSVGASGIGTGEAQYEGISRVDHLVIGNSDVVVRGLEYGSAIGTGEAPGGISRIDNLTIWNSSVIATSSTRGSGIGSSAYDYLSRIDFLMIANSTVKAHGAPDYAAIGSSGWRGEVHSLVFSGFCFIECNGSELGQMINASSITFSRAALTFITNDTALFGTSPSNNGSVDLVIAYRRVTAEHSERLSSLGGPFLHIGNITVSAPESRLSRLCVRRARFERCLNESADSIRSIIVRMGDGGHYSVRGWVNGLSYLLTASDGRESFDIDVGDLFVDVVSLGRLAPTDEFHPTTILKCTIAPGSEDLEVSRHIPASVSIRASEVFEGSMKPPGVGVSQYYIPSADMRLSALFGATAPPSARWRLPDPPPHRHGPFFID